MYIYLFRHGQTPGNGDRKYLGRTDEPLSQLGLKTIRDAGCDPHVDEVLVSPLQRTQMTAAILFPNARQRVCHGLREMDFGDFEGRSAQEMADDPDYRYWVEVTRCMGPCPHGDATMVFRHRVCETFRQEVEKAQMNAKERLYFVVHGGVVMSILDRFARPKAPFYSWPLDNGEGYRGRVVNGQQGLELVDILHLKRSGQ